MKHLTIIIITGLSGSGKSTAMAALEDAGFYCVDNMPVALLPKFLQLPVESNTEIAGFALVMDLREKGFLSKYSKVFESLKRKGYHFEILFLEAEEDVLVQRYSATRRQHPLSQGKSLLEGIRPIPMFMNSSPKFQKLPVKVNKLARCGFKSFLSVLNTVYRSTPT